MTISLGMHLRAALKRHLDGTAIDEEIERLEQQRQEERAVAQLSAFVDFTKQVVTRDVLQENTPVKMEINPKNPLWNILGFDSGRSVLRYSPISPIWNHFTAWLKAYDLELDIRTFSDADTGARWNELHFQPAAI